MSIKIRLPLIMVATVSCLMASQAHAVIITSGDIKLGVDSLGQLNVAPSGGEEGTVNVSGGVTGIAMFQDAGPSGAGFYDATAPGCLCEGWGVSASGVSGYANNAAGTAGLTAGVFSLVTASTVTVTTSLTGLTDLIIEQAYAPSAAAPGALFEDKVTITNTSGVTMTDLRYVRVMDWDIPFTEFSEFVTIKGTGTTADLEESHDDGFTTADPLSDSSDGILAGTNTVDFEDSGPADHGAYFRFNFGDLLAGESREFSIFYGASGSESSMLAALGAVGIELFSLGQSSGGATTGEPMTFAFGFKGVGGEVVLPPPGVPEPATLALMGLGLLGLGLARRRRR